VKLRHIVIFISIVLMVVGTWMGLVNSHTIDFPIPEPGSLAQQANIESRANLQRISDLLFCTGFITFIGFPVIDFYRWLKD
jgi:Trk-type K+ transport system membrane component